MNVNTIRKITIQGEGQQSLDSLATSLGKVEAASKGVASVTDIQTKRALSVADAYKRQTLAVVEGARAQDQLARSVRLLDQAMAQGVVKSTAEYNQRLALLQQKYGDVGRATQAMEKATQGLNNAFSMVRNAIGTLGLALGIGAMVAYGKSVFNTTADLQEQADQILGAGGNVEALQALRGIFLTNGVSQEQGDKILQKLTRSLGEAAEGSKKAQDAFHGMGLGAKELAGTTADAALPLVAKKLLEIEDATKRAALETQIFGRTGQQLESSLKALAAGSMNELIARARDLGVVIDKEMIEKADRAKDAMALSFMKLQVSLAPLIVSWGEGFSKLVTNIDKVTKSINALWDATKLFASIGVGARVGMAVGGLPGAAVGAAVGAVGYAASRGDQYQKAVANYDAQLASGSLSPSERADIQARRARALEQVNPTVGYSGLITLDKANGYIAPPPAANSNSGWEQTSAQMSAAAAAAKKLEDSRHKVMLDEKAIEASTNTILQAGIKQLQVSIKDEQHQAQVAEATDQYIRDLQTEVDMVGMSSDEREKQAAVMEAMRVSEKGLTSDQEKIIRSTVSARQEAERWRGVVDDISYGFQGFFEDVLNNGKLSFESLWETIKQSFVRMLAYMATQALINPIIVPMVTGVAGSIGGLFGGSGGSLSSLSSLGNIGGLFSGGLTGTSSNLFGGIGEAFGGGDFIGTASDSIFGSAGFGGFLGGAGLGSLAGSLVFGNKNSAGLGSMGGALAGAAIGSIIPGVGTIIGGLIGGLAGGGLGSLTGTSNQGAISNFTNGGLGNTLFKAGGGNNGALATQASGTINTTLQALKDAGVDVSLGNISGLSIGSDKSYVYDFAGGKQKLAGGEAGVQATVNAILDRILGSATSGDSAVQELLAKYGGLNSGNIVAFTSELQAQAAEKSAKAAADAAAEIKSLNDELGALANAVANAQDQLQRSYTAEQSAITKTITYHQQQAASLRDYLTTLQGGAAGGAGSYSAARSSFAAYAGLAGTDSFEASRLQQLGDNFLSASKSRSATLAQYRQDRSLVVNQVSAAASLSEGAASAAIRQLDALNASVEGLLQINQTLVSVKEAIESLQRSQDELGTKTAEASIKTAKLLTSVTRDGEALLTEAA